MKLWHGKHGHILLKNWDLAEISPREKWTEEFRDEEIRGRGAIWFGALVDLIPLRWIRPERNSGELLRRGGAARRKPERGAGAEELRGRRGCRHGARGGKSGEGVAGPGQIRSPDLASPAAGGGAGARGGGQCGEAAASRVEEATADPGRGEVRAEVRRRRAVSAAGMAAGGGGSGRGRRGSRARSRAAPAAASGWEGPGRAPAGPRRRGEVGAGLGESGADTWRGEGGGHVRSPGGHVRRRGRDGSRVSGGNIREFRGETHLYRWRELGECK